MAYRLCARSSRADRTFRRGNCYDASGTGTRADRRFLIACSRPALITPCDWAGCPAAGRRILVAGGTGKLPAGAQIEHFGTSSPFRDPQVSPRCPPSPPWASLAARPQAGRRRIAGTRAGSGSDAVSALPPVAATMADWSLLVLTVSSRTTPGPACLRPLCDLD